MTRTLSALVVVVVSVLAFAGCEKPSEEDCKKAISNMQALLGTDKLLATEDLQGAVRRCKGSSKKKAVQCAIDAKTLDQLKQCDFYGEPEKK